MAISASDDLYDEESPILCEPCDVNPFEVLERALNQFPLKKDDKLCSLLSEGDESEI